MPFLCTAPCAKGPPAAPCFIPFAPPGVDSSISLILQTAWCCCPVTKSCPTLCDPVNCSTRRPFTVSRSLLKLRSVESVMPSNHPILRRPLLLLPTIFPSIRVFSNDSALHIRRPKYWSFSFSINPSNSGLISFRTDWFDLLAVQGTLKSLLQHRSLKASILWHSHSIWSSSLIFM